jgi:hypothetical protein
VQLNLIIDWDLTDADKEVEAALEEIVAEEARTFTENIRRRLAQAGVTDIEMNLRESAS